MSWPTVEIGTVAEIVSGSTPSTTTPAYWGGEVPWATPADLAKLNGKLISSTPRTLTAQGLAASSARLLPVGSVLFSSRAPIGHVAINTVPMATNQGFKSFVPDPAQLSADFLYWWLRSNTTFLQGLGVGATFKEVSKSIVTSVRIPLPPLPEQRRIASTLDQAEELRALRRTALTKLDDLRVATFQERFGLARDLPETTLNELIDPERPLSYGILMPGPDVPDGVPYIRVTDFSARGVQLEKVRKTSPEIDAAFKRSRLKAGDLLLSIRGHVGRTALVPPEMEGANITQDTARIAVVGADAAYVKSWLDSPASQEWMRKHTKGVAVQGINLQDVRRIPVKLPPVAEQGIFGSIVRQLQLDRARAQRHLELLNATFESLQDLAFSNPA